MIRSKRGMLELANEQIQRIERAGLQIPLEYELGKLNDIADECRNDSSAQWIHDESLG